jgi:hypothetical protein
MVRKVVLLAMLSSGVFTAKAQLVHQTYYGDSSGTKGESGSYFGFRAGHSVADFSIFNSFFGAHSGQLTKQGDANTGLGCRTLYNNTEGNSNVATGMSALFNNTTGNGNTASGYFSLYSNTTGHYNVASGFSSLSDNTTGGENVASGTYAMRRNISGSYNIAIGHRSLYENLTGGHNIAAGAWSLTNNTTGGRNIAIGYYAMHKNDTGEYNSAVGFHAMRYNKGGFRNCALGSHALQYPTTGSFNSAIGYNAGPGPASTDVYNTTALGNGARPSASNQVRVGNTFVTSIGGAVAWSTISDGRFKTDVKEDVSGIDFITQLRPVSYTINKQAISKFLGLSDDEQPEAEKRQVRQTGFIAQEVHEVLKKTGFVFNGVESPQNENDHYSIRYAEFVVPLVKAFQELNAKVEEQQNRIDQLLTLLEENKTVNSERVPSPEAALLQNNPNPFSTDTQIKMILPKSAVQSDLKIYNLEGTQLKSIIIRERGQVSITLDAHELKPGIYLYALIIDNIVIDMKRMVLTK